MAQLGPVAHRHHPDRRRRGLELVRGPAVRCLDKAAFVSAFITGLCLYAAVRSPTIRAASDDTVTYLTNRHMHRPGGA